MKTVKTEMETAVNRESDLEIMATDIIRQLGIPAHIKGYWYLRYALILCTENNEMITSVTKTLYPAVAEKFNTFPSRVSSNISRAIETAWDNKNEEVLRQYLGKTVLTRKKKPTNAEFIASVSEMLRIRIKMQK